MANWHGYIAIENLNLNAAQRVTLIAEIQALGPASDPQPARLNHWRTRLDGEAAIFEALFNEGNLTINRFKQRLGSIFGIAWNTIDHSVQNITFDTRTTPIVTFSRGGTNYLRVAAFAGTGATWAQSLLECAAYLAANAAEWETADD